MRQRWGLRAKMTASYLLVTAAAVLVVELVLLVPLLLPRGEPTADPVLDMQLIATKYSAQLIDPTGQLPAPGEIQLGEPGHTVTPGEIVTDKSGRELLVPRITTKLDDSKPVTLALLLDPDLKIVATSYSERYPVGARVDGPGVGPLPVDAITKFALDPKGRGGQTTAPNGDVVWAVAPIIRLSADLSGKITKPAAEPRPMGVIYLQAPATPALFSLPRPLDSGGGNLWDSVFSGLGAGLLVMVVALPVGVVFGLMSARPLIRRLRRLAASTVAVAEGQYHHRVPVTGADEIAQLEGNFNRMAERLSDAMAAERNLASASERARIARELHDSISQDLFSMRLLAGGLRRALPSESPLAPQVEALERTATGTMHEMQALLLELRPVVLQDNGLIPALQELCQAYRDRLGVAVDTVLQPVTLDPAVEHAVLRIVQEAMANAVKHARPNRIGVRLTGTAGGVEVSITDDGSGFDVSHAAERHGMGLELMRERAAELGGTFQLDSTPGSGTTVRIVLP